MGYRNDPLALKTFGLRWVAPLVNIAAGAVTGLMTLGVAASQRNVGWSALLGLLAAWLLACGVAALVWRIRARFHDHAWAERRANRLGDLATLAAWTALASAPVVWAGQGVVLTLGKPYVVEGYVADVAVDPGRHSNALKLRLVGAPRTFRWRCGRHCGAWDHLETDVTPGATVRITAVGDRILGLQTQAYNLLSPDEERGRWIWGDLQIGALGLVFAAAAGAATVIHARRFSSV